MPKVQKISIHPKVSVIVTTKNSAKTLGQLLQSIKKQSYPTLELILVDNHSSDDTISIAKQYTELIFTFGPERSAQRNFGAKKATGSYLLFLDADMVLTPDVVKACIACLSKDKLGGIVIHEISRGSGIWARAKILERQLNSDEDYFEAARFFPKKIFDEFEGYDISLTGPEDWDLPERISKKYPILRITNVIFHNEGNLSLIYLVKKKFYYGISAYKYLKKQSIPVISKKTVYFLRPGFYKNWRKIISDPITGIAMICMLTAENIAGGAGYILGRVRYEK